jgi:hypothetical protein
MEVELEILILLYDKSLFFKELLPVLEPVAVWKPLLVLLKM